jgi:hypothetical protein
MLPDAMSITPNSTGHCRALLCCGSLLGDLDCCLKLGASMAVLPAGCKSTSGFKVAEHGQVWSYSVPDCTPACIPACFAGVSRPYPVAFGDSWTQQSGPAAVGAGQPQQPSSQAQQALLSHGYGAAPPPAGWGMSQPPAGAPAAAGGQRPPPPANMPLRPYPQF